MRQTDPRHDAAFRLRIAKSLAMVSADNDHLALVAARTADVREAGLTWLELLGQEPESEHIADPRQIDLLEDWPLHWRIAVHYCTTNADALNEKSAAFVEQLTHYQRLPSARQLDWLKNCVSHIQRGGGA